MRRTVLTLALAGLVTLAVADAAFAAHSRPKSASPLAFKLVPAFNQCLGASPPGMTHGAPLALPSCSPPIETSSYLTMQAPDRPAPLQGPADGTGTVVLKVTCHTPGTTNEIASSPCAPSPAGENIDVRITTTTSGVRCVGAAGQKHGPHGGQLVTCGALHLFDGMVLGIWTIRISDHYNAIDPNPTGADCSDTTTCVATGQDLPFRVGIQCNNGACNSVTSSDLVIPDFAREGKRAVLGLGQVQIQDAGLDGDLVPGPPPGTGICPPSCAQNDAFSTALVQGLLVP